MRSPGRYLALPAQCEVSRDPGGNAVVDEPSDLGEGAAGHDDVELPVLRDAPDVVEEHPAHARAAVEQSVSKDLEEVGETQAQQHLQVVVSKALYA
jgi:hypothetical protein